MFDDTRGYTSTLQKLWFQVSSIGGHGTGNVGHLFGCSSNVTGDPSRVVAAAAVEGLPLGAGPEGLEKWATHALRILTINDLGVLGILIPRNYQ